MSSQKKLSSQDLPTVARTIVQLATDFETQLIEQAIRTENLLTEQRHGLQAAQEKRSSLSATITAETEQLLREQEIELRAARDTVKDEIATMYITEAKLKDDLKRLQDELGPVSLDLEAKKDRVSTLRSELDQLGILVSERTTELDAVSARYEGIVSALPQQQADIRANEEILSGLRAAIDEESIRHDALKEDSDRIEHENAAKITKYENQVGALKARANDLTDQRIAFERETELVRKDLAGRLKQLEKRDEVVTLRERKVNMAEDRVRANANLIDL